jgi:hypothetical protein
MLTEIMSRKEKMQQYGWKGWIMPISDSYVDLMKRIQGAHRYD